MITALVTGASGFIGSTLIEELNERGIKVRALLRSTSSTANLKGLEYEEIHGDLSDIDSLNRATQDVDYIFHLAGAIVAKNEATFFKHNVEGTRNLAAVAASSAKTLKRFVFVSSLAAGGPSHSIQPRQEADTDRPVSAYGRSKLCAEAFLLHHKHTFPITIIRPPMVYGPKDKATFLFVDIINRNIMPIIKSKIVGDGQKHYSFIHVRDLCEGILKAALDVPATLPSGDIFYLTGNGSISYEGFLRSIAHKLDRKPLKIGVNPVFVTAAAYALQTIGTIFGRNFHLNPDKLNELFADYWICSNTKAKSVLGFNPKYDFEKGLLETINWYKDNKWI